MSRSRHGVPDPQNQALTDDAIRDELLQVCASEPFRKSERQKRFLAFVVQQTLSGNAGEIKEPVVAMEVFDRSADYDPKVDTIVRVEARRLRTKLAEYYSSSGAADPIRIELPIGSYVPVFQVQALGPDPGVAVEPIGNQAGRRLWLWTVAFALIVVSGTAFFWLRQRPAANTSPRVAVLPFQNLNPQGVDELYSDGVTEALITDLAKIRRLQVISRTSVQRFKNTRQTLREIATQLQVDYVVEGSFQRNGDRCRITAQLIRTNDDVHVWAETYDLPFTDILRVQQRAAAGIVDRVNVALDPSERHVLENQPTSSTEAYEDLLKARKNSYQYLFLGKQDYYDEAERLLQRAIQLDPAYADAILERALLDGRRYQNTGDTQWLHKAEDGFLAALRREPCDPLANALMASVRNEDGEINSAMQYGRRAVDCGPNSAQAHNSLGLVYLSDGFFEAAAGEFRNSSRVDPVFVSPLLNLSGTLMLLNQKTDAVAVARKATEIEPESALSLAILGIAWMKSGNLAEARAAWDKAARFVGPQQVSGVGDLLQGLEDAASGHKESVRKLLRRHQGERWLQGVLWRGVYQELLLSCGEPAEVLALLERAPEFRSYRFLVSSSALAGMSSDPAFAHLLRQRYQLWQEQLSKYRALVWPPPPKLPPPETVIRR
jgi:TolB-like protein/cytochrome c-type biogenesis protein CcmH/NrfG